MRHLHAGRKLKRTSSHLLAMKRNMANSLIAHDRIETTLPKAKELRPFVERLVTLAKKSAAAATASNNGADKDAVAKSLHYRKQIISRLGGGKLVQVGENNVNVVGKLIENVAARYQTRLGGYTRVMKTTRRRLGDAGAIAIIEFV